MQRIIFISCVHKFCSIEQMEYHIVIVASVSGAVLFLFCACFCGYIFCRGYSRRDFEKIIKWFNSVRQKQRHVDKMKERRNNDTGILENRSHLEDGKLCF